jgi:hypothetical protein
MRYWIVRRRLDLQTSFLRFFTTALELFWGMIERYQKATLIPLMVWVLFIWTFHGTVFLQTGKGAISKTFLSSRSTFRDQFIDIFPRFYFPILLLWKKLSSIFSITNSPTAPFSRKFAVDGLENFEKCRQMRDWVFWG